MGKSRFVFRNLNPSRRECDDDVVRALALALQKDWTAVYADLCALGAKMSCMPTDKVCYRAYLFGLGFMRIGVSNRKGSRRPTVQHFAEAHREGVYLLQAARRLVPVIDGHYYDITDCGTKCLYAYWHIPAETRNIPLPYKK